MTQKIEGAPVEGKQKKSNMNIIKIMSVKYIKLDSTQNI